MFLSSCAAFKRIWILAALQLGHSVVFVSHLGLIRHVGLVMYCLLQCLWYKLSNITQKEYFISYYLQMWNFWLYWIYYSITVTSLVIYIDRYRLAVSAKYTRSELLMTTEDSFPAGFVMRYETFVYIWCCADLILIPLHWGCCSCVNDATWHNEVIHQQPNNLPFRWIRLCWLSNSISQKLSIK